MLERRSARSPLIATHFLFVPAFWAWDASKASVRTREATKKYVKEAFITPAQAAFRDLKSCREECYFLELLKAHEIPAVNVSQER
jgi:hypothetical protein